MSASQPRLILASASASRRRILADAGIVFEAIVSGFEESWEPDDDPAETVLALARGKASSVAAGRDAYVLGCDSLFVVSGALVGKPRDAAEALERWRTMAGHDGVLYTGYALAHDEYLLTEAVATKVTFARPTEEELTAYIATGESMGNAGGFTLEGRSSAFIERVDGDPNNVLGLSVATLRRLLGELGVPISRLWR